MYRDRAGGWADDQRTAPDSEAFRRLPFITKADIRNGFPHNFLAEGVDLETLLDLDLVELEQTSGTSEVRTPLLLGRGWWAEQERRALRTNRYVAAILDEFPEARRVTIGSPVCNGDVCYTGVPSRAERIVGESLFVNLSRHPYLWSTADLDRMAVETREWQPLFLDLDPVYGVQFALHCERQGLRFPSLRFIMCSYEYLSVVHRSILGRAFGVPVFNLYGSTETGHLLMESEHGSMRASEETAFLEIVEKDANGVGDLVVTTLTNEYTPLVRYRIGDLVELREGGEEPDWRVHGRTADAILTPDSHRVTVRQIDQCFEDLAGFAHYQLRQLETGEWSLRYTPDKTGPGAKETDELHRRLTLILGHQVAPRVQGAETLLAESSGKFRLVYPAERPAGSA